MQLKNVKIEGLLYLPNPTTFHQILSPKHFSHFGETLHIRLNFLFQVLKNFFRFSKTHYHNLSMPLLNLKKICNPLTFLFQQILSPLKICFQQHFNLLTIYNPIWFIISKSKINFFAIFKCQNLIIHVKHLNPWEIPRLPGSRKQEINKEGEAFCVYREFKTRVWVSYLQGQKR